MAGECNMAADTVRLGGREAAEFVLTEDLPDVSDFLTADDVGAAGLSNDYDERTQITGIRAIFSSYSWLSSCFSFWERKRNASMSSSASRNEYPL